MPRRWPIGAECVPGGGVHFRVWAPRCHSVAVVLDDGPEVPLAAEEGGYFSGFCPTATAGSRYRFRLDDEARTCPDPASRWQPDGPHGPSMVIDPKTFVWTDQHWSGIGPKGQVLYEMHVGTFTPEGTWDAACEQLPELAALGITAVEIMPVADFPGRFGWGYDGVNLFAPSRLYGPPDALRRFVDQAHALGLGVILDVVYNHVGPDGNYLARFSPHYFSGRSTPWGPAFNFDGLHCEPVREWIVTNAAYWVEEFHIDGLRLDAAQAMIDSSPEHILRRIGLAVRQAARGRATFLIAECEPPDGGLVRPAEEGGQGLDALWNDDFHRAAQVALTGRAEGYFEDYRGTPQELISAAKRGFLFQGQPYRHYQHRPRGTPAWDLPPWAFIHYLDNHDQISAWPCGQRIHQRTSPGRWRALTALLLLGPQTPMLFQGQEFAASSPFLFFADHHRDLARAVAQGRAKFLAQFPSLSGPEAQGRLADPAELATFQRCQLDATERRRHAAAVALHRDLIHLRRQDAVFRDPRPGSVDGAVLGPAALVLRFFGPKDDRLLLINLGADLRLDPIPEPLLAPPGDGWWEVVWSSEAPRYGGGGTPPLRDTAGVWCLPGEAALVLAPGSPPAG
ncbi:MAG: malto-oligosyltrehalose trehalohydrolase [Gemmataceae bacterium]|nr:malto-oligosyltrehalose trehalohydrolase [Gemmataceae bacterium]MDW8265536.1 malto-oligosyltrehalose trehalohydrolase [Gemmataceae bacterium]